MSHLRKVASLNFNENEFRQYHKLHPFCETVISNQNSVIKVLRDF